MQKMRLEYPYMIVMVGLPGSGKSTFAERFVDIFSTPIVSYNTTQQLLSDSALNRAIGSKNIQNLLQHQLTELSKTGQPVVYDSIKLSKADYFYFTRLAKSMEYKLIFVWVQTDAAIAKGRATKAGYSDEAYAKAVQSFTAPNVGDDTVVISGRHTFASQLKIVLRHLSNHRTGNAAIASPRHVRNK